MMKDRVEGCGEEGRIGGTEIESKTAQRDS